MVESENQQQIYRWVRTNLNLPSFQGQIYTEWELRQAFKRRMLDKSSYSEILVKFGVPNSTLTYFLNILFVPLKCSSLKHLWDLMGVGKRTQGKVREVIEKIVVNTKRGENLPSQGQRSIHYGNIRNIWGTWKPKIYTYLN